MSRDVSDSLEKKESFKFRYDKSQGNYILYKHLYNLHQDTFLLESLLITFNECEHYNMHVLRMVRH